jgi:hypothetical protein
MFSQIAICQNNLQDKESREINSLSDFSKDLSYHLIKLILQIKTLGRKRFSPKWRLKYQSNW